MDAAALEFLAKFVDVRLQEVEFDGVNLFGNMEPVGIQLKGDPDFVPDQMMFEFNNAAAQVIFTLNSEVLEKIRESLMSPSLLQNAAAGVATIGVANLSIKRQGRVLSIEEQQLVCRTEVDRIGNMMTRLAKQFDVSGRFLQGKDLQQLD